MAMFTAELDQTIAAVASAPGGAGRGIVRVSGVEAVALVDKVFASTETDEEPASKISYRATGTITIPDFPPVLTDAWA
ncbi:MAG: tRNA modification GTPase, partial [Planctomycetaceae bacterium]